jgi:hypothetical protein
MSTIPSSSTSITLASSVAFLLAEFHCAALRSRLLTAEIEGIGMALRGNFITADDAIDWAASIGVDLIAASPTVTATS